MKNTKVKLLIVGRTGSGKDYIADLLSKKYGLKKLKSYATRPKRSKDDDSHIFISNDEVEKYRNDMITYTEIGEYKYFATKQQLDESDIYIIDPYGIEYLMNTCKDEYYFAILYVVADKDQRIAKAIERSDNTNEEAVSNKRNIAEGAQFDNFEKIIPSSYVRGKRLSTEIIYNTYDENIEEIVDGVYSKYFG